ncbi:rhodanese-like domain-containing protein [Ferroacidibacillus organovorans]|uniref:rhodanese-like domain-containing protein n=1 Tax=Ferroacidibacillus organovorans TaxID=1765683 RepID=UPI0018D277CD|nr:rhodanese-like domain-containing protein [Ferroacidibacillus organovorans]
MNYTWLILVLVIVAYFFWSRKRGSGVSQISSATLQERLKSDASSLEIVDVREPSEFKSGHIAKARNIPLGTLDRMLAEIPKDKDVVFVCRSGARSSMAARKAQKGGLKAIYNLTGGMSSWSGPVKK